MHSSCISPRWAAWRCFDASHRVTHPQTTLRAAVASSALPRPRRQHSCGRGAKASPAIDGKVFSRVSSLSPWLARRAGEPNFLRLQTTPIPPNVQSPGKSKRIAEIETIRTDDLRCFSFRRARMNKNDRLMSVRLCLCARERAQ